MPAFSLLLGPCLCLVIIGELSKCPIYLWYSLINTRVIHSVMLSCLITSHMSGVSLRSVQIWSQFIPDKTRRVQLSPGLGTCWWDDRGQIVFDVGHFDRNRCPQSQCLIWVMTLSLSPSNTSLTRQLGLCSTGGNRLGDWSRRVWKYISEYIFQKHKDSDTQWWDRI